MPACATSVTQERWSAGMARNQGELVVHPGHGLGGQRPGRPLEPPEGRRRTAGGLLTRLLTPASVSRAAAVGESGAVNVPPDGAAVVTRTRAAAAGAAGVVAVVAAWCCSRCSAPAVRTDFGPQLRPRRARSARRSTPATTGPRALDVLLEVLTAPGLVVVPVRWSSCRCWSGSSRRRPGGRRRWVVAAVVLVGPLTVAAQGVLRPGPAATSTRAARATTR